MVVARNTGQARFFRGEPGVDDSAPGLEFWQALGPDSMPVNASDKEY
jgi:hypothetical protein